MNLTPLIQLTRGGTPECLHFGAVAVTDRTGRLKAFAGDPHLVTFTRSTLINDPLTVNFIVSGAAVFGSDYTQSGASSFSTIMGTVSFGFGQMTAILVINPTSDSTVESNEEVTLSVIGGTGYSIGAISTAIGMIVNDDR